MEASIPTGEDDTESKVPLVVVNDEDNEEAGEHQTTSDDEDDDGDSDEELGGSQHLQPSGKAAYGCDSSGFKDKEEAGEHQTTSDDEDDDGDSDEELGESQHLQPSFEEVCNFAVVIGKAAYGCGSSGFKVEQFMPLIMERFGYYGVFRLTQSEIFCTFMTEELSLSNISSTNTIMLEIHDGLNLNKLGLLAELVDLVLEQKVSLNAALRKLNEIKVTPDPWNVLFVIASFLIVGGGLSMALGGTWWDVLVGTFLGGICWTVVTLLAQKPRFVSWTDFVASFVCSAVASMIKLLSLPRLNVTLVVLSAVAILLPGYGISLGTSELVSNRVVSGAAHLMNGIVTLLWLVVGTWLGIRFVAAITNTSLDEAETEESLETVPDAWLGLFVPLLCLSLGLVFQNSRRDIGWSVLITGLTFTISYGASFITRPNVGTLLSSVAMTLMANGWASAMNRPNSLVLLPSIVLQVSGSIGFRGVLNLIAEGDASLGTEQLLQMFVVALLIVAGLLAGNTILPPATTL
jgi:uncharacterized membrane protein YjjP (DUF1212 family)